MAKAKIDTGHNSNPLAYEYKHIDHEPLMLQFNMLMAASGTTYSEIMRKTGISYTTLARWADKKTRRPNSSTLRMAFKALGYTLKPVRE